MSTLHNTDPKCVVHRAKGRGHVDHGWLDARHSFSFAGWHDPNRIHFGALRVFNDDVVAGGAGFGMHPHDNMEIVTIPLSGALAHKDSMGNASVIRNGEVQAMTAGTGILHSEYNHSDRQPVKLFQVWVYPNQKDLSPRYDQHHYDLVAAHGSFVCLVTPDGSSGVKIHQNAWFYLGEFNAGQRVSHLFHGPGQGAYLMVVEGEAKVLGHRLGRRDAIGVWASEQVEIQASRDCVLLLIEVPMHW